ncbi:MAG: hypothetical protein Q7S96_01745 [bacterium]|nr:hypothetical protein [bacterium]
MRRFPILLLFALVAAGTLAGGRIVFAGNISSTNKYAWSENVGWLNFGTSEGNVTVADTALTGYAWGENVGWISLNCSNTSSCATVDYKVANNGSGTLTGHAWGENVGWIVFNPTGGGITINSSGDFAGYAWGENVGWIVFNCSTTSSCATVSYKVATTWTASSASGSPPSAGGDTTPPGKVTNIQVTPGADHVLFTWTDPPDTDLAHVDIFRNQPPSSAVSGVLLRRVSRGAQRLLDTPLASATSYSYLFRTVDGANNATTSDTIVVTTTGEDAPAPAASNGGGGGGGVIIAPTPYAPPAAPTPVPAVAGSPTLGLTTNTHVKSPVGTAVYTIGPDNKRYTYPNEMTYKSWHDTFAHVGAVADTSLAVHALGGIMTIRGGTWLVKIESDPKVYAVEPGGILRWVETEARARLLFGEDWNKQVVDVPVSFWPSYTLGTPLGADIHPTGTLVRSDDTILYVERGVLRPVRSNTFTALSFQNRFVRTLHPSLIYSYGDTLTSLSE